MSACTLFNEQDKGSNLLSIITLSVLGQQNVQAKKVYWKSKVETRGQPLEMLAIMYLSNSTWISLKREDRSLLIIFFGVNINRCMFGNMEFKH